MAETSLISCTSETFVLHCGCANTAFVSGIDRNKEMNSSRGELSAQLCVTMCESLCVCVCVCSLVCVCVCMYVCVCCFVFAFVHLYFFFLYVYVCFCAHVCTRALSFVDVIYLRNRHASVTWTSGTLMLRITQTVMQNEIVSHVLIVRQKPSGTPGPNTYRYMHVWQHEVHCTVLLNMCMLAVSLKFPFC